MSSGNGAGGGVGDFSFPFPDPLRLAMVDARKTIGGVSVMLAMKGCK